jgi:hypothetical protein
VKTEHRPWHAVRLPLTAIAFHTSLCAALLLCVVVLQQWGLAAPARANAAPTDCGAMQDPQSYNGGTVNSVIVAVGDPGCFGTRAKAYDHAASSTTNLDSIRFDAPIGRRHWNCGALWSQGFESNTTPPVNGVFYLGSLGVWLPSNSCGWQADQNALFHKVPVADRWIYVNW